jgi:hypothetical protein
MKFEEAYEIIGKEVYQFADEVYKKPNYYNTTEYYILYDRLGSYSLVKKEDELHLFYRRNDSVYIHHKEQYRMLQRYKELMGDDFPKSYYTYVARLDKIREDRLAMEAIRQKQKTQI